MAQASSGSTVVKVKREVTAQPFVIETGDATLKAWLDKLVNAVGLVGEDFATKNDLNETADSAALWAARVLDTNGQNPGSAYVVSAEVAKRIEAGRY